MLPALGTRIDDAPRRGRLTRRQLLVRGGLAAGGLMIAGFVIRAATLFNQKPAPDRRVLSSREVGILAALIEAVFPGDSESPAGDPVFMTTYIDDYLAQTDGDVRLLFKSLLQVIEELSFPSFSRLSLADRFAVVRAWEVTPIFLRRAAFASMKLVLGMGYFAQPGVSESIGWYVGCAPPHLIDKSRDRVIHGTS